MKHVELKTADAILKRGIRAKVRAPLFLRWLGIRYVWFTIKNLYAGTLLEMSRYYLMTGIADEDLEDISREEALSLMRVHGRTIAKAVAAAILNDRLKIALFTKPLSHYLLHYMTWEEILTILDVCLYNSGTSDFMNTTRLVRLGKLTDPANQGPKKKTGS